MHRVLCDLLSLFVIAVKNCLFFRREVDVTHSIRDKSDEFILEFFGAEHLLRFLSKFKQFLVDYLKTDWKASVVEAACIRQCAAGIVRYLDLNYDDIFQKFPESEDKETTTVSPFS